MSLDGTQIEIICSNNGSEKNVEGYEELKKIRDQRFHYHEFSVNQEFAGNINQVIKMSHGDFCMLLSDEDWILEENLGFYLQIMEKYPDIGVIRPRTGYAFADIEDCFAGAGKQAIDAFYMRGIYVSGMIFNRHIITDQIINEYAERYQDNTGYLYYPHMFLSTYALLRGHFFASDVWLVSEGETETDLKIMDKTEEIPAYDAYDIVIEQMQGFIEQIKDLGISFQMRFDMLVMVFMKILNFEDSGTLSVSIGLRACIPSISRTVPGSNLSFFPLNSLMPVTKLYSGTSTVSPARSFITSDWR